MNNDGLVTGEDVWILPMSRLQEELGMSAIYRSGGSAALIWPDGKEILLNRIDGVQYMHWEDFTVLREDLIDSHLIKRPNYAVREKKRLEKEKSHSLRPLVS